jgi:hypothetical protein
MNTSLRHLGHSALFASAAAALMMASSCATRPPVADKFSPVTLGTVTTYHRVSSGSLGKYDGKVVWTHKADTWQGKPVIWFGAPQAGTSLHDPDSQALIANLDATGKPLVSFDPPFDYQWPLVVGKQWTSKHTFNNLVNGRSTAVTYDWKVEAWGDVTVPAGTFKAYKLVWSNSLGESETRWIAPADGIATIKRHVERVPSHPQGAGVLDAELLSRVVPAN